MFEEVVDRGADARYLKRSRMFTWGYAREWSADGARVFYRDAASGQLIAWASADGATATNMLNQRSWTREANDARGVRRTPRQSLASSLTALGYSLQRG